MTVEDIAAGLHGLDVVDGGRTLRLTGTCRRPGTDGDAPSTQELVLHVVDHDGRVRHTAATAPQRRYERDALTWSGFTADVPLDDLPPGRLVLRMEIDPAGPAAASCVVNATPGVLAPSRATTAGGRRFQAWPLGSSARVQLRVERATAGGRVRWAVGTIRLVAADVVRRRPHAWAIPARVLTRPLRGRRPIWLIGERPDTARDNGRHVFAHLRTHRPDVRAYYVVERDSEGWSEVAGLGHVVAHSSWRHRWLMLHATVLANAYSITHMVPRQWDPPTYARLMAWRLGAYRVYLKHGINLRDVRRRTTGYDLYLTGTAAETTSMRTTSGYDHHVVLTGLPRYDALVPTERSRTILFMPTWRLYLSDLEERGAKGTVPFEGSTYQAFVLGLLASPRLHALLEQHDHRLQLLPHYNLGARLDGLEAPHERIAVVDAATSDIQDVMRACDLFVTDYSSVQFDLAYLGTPIVYAQFDVADYEAGHAHSTWFDYRRDGFGPVVADVDATVDAIGHYLATGCEREPAYARRAEQAFAFHDRDNSRRVVETIEHLVRTRGIS